MKRTSLVVVFVSAILGYGGSVSVAFSADAPVPLLKKGHAADWWFVFKLNAAMVARIAIILLLFAYFSVTDLMS